MVIFSLLIARAFLLYFCIVPLEKKRIDTALFLNQNNVDHKVSALIDVLMSFLLAIIYLPICFSLSELKYTSSFNYYCYTFIPAVVISRWLMYDPFLNKARKFNWDYENPKKTGASEIDLLEKKAGLSFKMQRLVALTVYFILIIFEFIF